MPSLDKLFEGARRHREENNYWPQARIAILERIYPHGTPEEIIEAVNQCPQPAVTMKSVYDKAHQLGLKRSREAKAINALKTLPDAIASLRRGNGPDVTPIDDPMLKALKATGQLYEDDPRAVKSYRAFIGALPVFPYPHKRLS